MSNPLPASIARSVASIAIMALACALTPFASASGYTEKTLHSFCNGANCSDGIGPYGGLLMDHSGNLYGTANLGGKHSDGLLFKLIPNGDGSYKEYILHNFCARANCTDGTSPQAELIMDVDGNLYGTTKNGGRYNNAGVIFKLTHRDQGWSLTVLHNFCSINLGAQCADGWNPSSGLTYAGQASGESWDESSPLFGTTFMGGQNGNGVAFKLLINGGEWQESIVHDFNTAYGPIGLIMDGPGNLFGVTANGGKNGNGILYRLAAGTWKQTILHNFCAEANCADGANPFAKPIMDSAGNLFGTTFDGGSGPNCSDSFGCGVVFERTAGGGYSVIYKFCSQANCSDGWYPEAALAIDASGNLFGTASNGGANDSGAAFELKPNGKEKVLYSFCSKANCKDGDLPGTPLLLDGHGDLFGTTNGGGANGDYGTVFELTP